MDDHIVLDTVGGGQYIIVQKLGRGLKIWHGHQGPVPQPKAGPLQQDEVC